MPTREVSNIEYQIEGANCRNFGFDCHLYLR